MNSKDCTLHPTPYTPHPSPYTPHPTLYTPNPKLQTPNPKPQSHNPRSKTPNQRHQTPNTGRGRPRDGGRAGSCAGGGRGAVPLPARGVDGRHGRDRGRASANRCVLVCGSANRRVLVCELEEESCAGFRCGRGDAWRGSERVKARRGGGG